MMSSERQRSFQIVVGRVVLESQAEREGEMKM